MGKIQLFYRSYKKAAEKEIKKYEAFNKKNLPKKEHEKNDHIVLGFKNSMRSEVDFMNGRMEESLGALFDQAKAKSHVYENESLKRMLRLSK